VATRLLVVDDGAQFRRRACELLALRGFPVVDAVADGDAALAYVEGTCPDGVLVDQPAGKGRLAIAASLSSACPKARIVLTSSDVEQVPQTTLDACGAFAFVPKTSLLTSDLIKLFGPATA
jgi:DNA-binding NarL/FixJ family response regulator